MPGKKQALFLYKLSFAFSIKIKIKITVYTKIVSSEWLCLCWRAETSKWLQKQYTALMKLLDRKMANVHRLKCHVGQGSIWLNWSNSVTYYEQTLLSQRLFFLMFNFWYILSWVRPLVFIMIFLFQAFPKWE